MKSESLLTPPSNAIMPAAESARRGASPAEVRADLFVHVTGLILAPAGVGWMLVTFLPTGTDLQRACAIVYGVGLAATLCASAAYNLAGVGPLKARLRRLDHAAIFVMIAGTYTPFSLIALPPAAGVPLCAIVWALAAIGGVLKLRDSHCRERSFLALYLVMGWALLPLLPSFVASLQFDVLALLLIGGAIYSLGALIHARGIWRFHNAIWHAMVLTAASLHFVAVARLLGSP